MIRLTKISTVGGKTTFIFRYDLQGAEHTLTVSKCDLEERLKKLQTLLGRELTLKDVRDVVVQIITEVRAGREPFRQQIPYDQFLNVDLEA